ncbi:hypothetical protein [Thalassobacillus hwangdonensis]|uniref:Uncharacterized protein n=1 Tax=Thalassobacillus hwangdonensis TaxID=546108 RepID=A0ABW3L0K6_9BACI
MKQMWIALAGIGALVAVWLDIKYKGFGYQQLPERLKERLK